MNIFLLSCVALIYSFLLVVLSVPHCQFIACIHLKNELIVKKFGLKIIG